MLDGRHRAVTSRRAILPPPEWGGFPRNSDNQDFGIQDPGTPFTIDFDTSTSKAYIKFEERFMDHLNEDKFHYGMGYWYIRYIPVVEKVIIAIPDSGLDESDPDVNGKLWHNPGEIPGNGIDDDNNGYVDDVTGWNFFYRKPPFPPDQYQSYGHALPMAYIIAAEKNDSSCTAGINPDVQLMNLNLGFNTAAVLPELSTIVPALRYAINKGAKIINISFIDIMGKYKNEYKPYYAEPISAGLMVVCGAGNEGEPIFYPPQIYPDMTVVAGIRTFARAWWNSFEYGKYFIEGNSSYGPQVSFMALYDINTKSFDLSPYPVASSGTSYCGPQICAIAARIWGNNPGLTRQEVLNIMKECCLPLDPSPYGNKPSGFGYIDCKKLALRYVNIQTKRVNLILKDGKKAVLEMDFVYAKNGGLYKRCTKFLYAYGKKYAINREV